MKHNLAATSSIVRRQRRAGSVSSADALATTNATVRETGATPAWRQRPGRKRQSEIIDAAARVFAQKGFHGATTGDIADVLGIRQASLYYYFPSKEVALEIVCVHGAEGFFDAAQAIVESNARAPQRLALLLAAHLQPLNDKADYVKVFLKERQHLPNGSRRKVGRWSRGIERLFERVIREGVADGSIIAGTDPRLATLALLGMTNAVADWYGKERRTIDEIATAITALALHGLTRRTRQPG